MPTALLLPFVIAALGQSTPATPRDRQTSSTVSAAIAGTVLSDDAQPLPVRRARVTLAGSDGSGVRATVTDDRGRFTFDGLAAGRYDVTVTKDGWISTAYGARRPLGPGTAVALEAGARARIAIRLLHGAVITGQLIDQHGLPAAGATVRALRVSMRRGERALEITGAPAVADDRGIYRIYGLPPGDYVVRATWRPDYFGTDASELRLASDIDVRSASGPDASRAPGVPMEATIAMAPTFYPGTTVPGEASAVTLAGGDERAGVDFRLHLVPTARLEGTVIAADGRPLPPGLSVNLIAVAGAPLSDRPIDVHRDTPVMPDGSFTFVDVAPGQYTVFTRAALSGADGPTIVWASTDVPVEGDPISGLDLVLRAGTTLSGRLRFEGHAPRVDMKRVRVHLLPEEADRVVRFGPASAGIDAEGRFIVQGVAPGRYRLTAAFPGLGRPGGWLLRSAKVGGVETLDVPVTIQPGRPADEALIELTDRMAELGGHVTDAAGAPATPCTVILFPRESARWMPSSRRIQTAAPSTDGAFSFYGLPPGDYLLAALDDVEPGEWSDPAFLKRLAPSAAPVVLSGTERTVQNIQIPGRR